MYPTRFNQLDPGINTGPWNPDEDQHLLEAQRKFGNRSEKDVPSLCDLPLSHFLMLALLFNSSYQLPCVRLTNYHVRVCM